MKAKLMTIAMMAALMLAVTTTGNSQNGDVPCLPQSHGLTEHQSARCGIMQVLELAAGWNWISLYIAVEEPEEMILLFEAGLEDNGVQIKSVEEFTSYEDEEWFGGLDDVGLVNEQMYKVLTTAACTVELDGQPADPGDYVIYINPGPNWIGFPCTEEVDVMDALAGFDAAEGDQLKAADDYTTFEDEEWFGDLETMVPGQGYIYISMSDETKALVIQTGAKGRR